MLYRALKEVFSSLVYVFIAFFVAILVFALCIWIPNAALIVELFRSPDISFIERLSVPFLLLQGMVTNFTVFSAAYLIIVSALFGINISLMAYSVARARNSFRNTGLAMGTGGAILGILSVGCAACGSLVITSILSWLGIAGALAFLPFGGEELGFVSIGLLIFSNCYVLRRIAEPKICEIHPEEKQNSALSV